MQFSSYEFNEYGAIETHTLFKRVNYTALYFLTYFPDMSKIPQGDTYKTSPSNLSFVVIGAVKPSGAQTNFRPHLLSSMG
jgi:hypothetical protein